VRTVVVGDVATCLLNFGRGVTNCKVGQWACSVLCCFLLLAVSWSSSNDSEMLPVTGSSTPVLYYSWYHLDQYKYLYLVVVVLGGP
jgi:hypothetical protein